MGLISLDKKSKAAINVSSSFSCEVEEPVGADNPFLAAKPLICTCNLMVPNPPPNSVVSIHGKRCSLNLGYIATYP